MFNQDRIATSLGETFARSGRAEESATGESIELDASRRLAGILQEALDLQETRDRAMEKLFPNRRVSGRSDIATNLGTPRNLDEWLEEKGRHCREWIDGLEGGFDRLLDELFRS